MDDTNPPVDGSGLQLHEHCRSLAELLNLSQPQAALLLAELRNALVPTLMAMEMMPRSTANVALCERGVGRVLELAAAIGRRVAQ